MKLLRNFVMLTSSLLLLLGNSLQLSASDYDFTMPEGSLNYVEIPREVDLTYSEEEVEVLKGTLPSRYDARANGQVSAVDNQNPYGTCWSFATMAALEGSVLSQGLYGSVDLSEYHLINYNYHSVVDPLGGTAGDSVTYLYDMATCLDRGHNMGIASYALLNWMGAAQDTGYVSNPNYVMPATVESAYMNSMVHLQNVYMINKDDVAAIKEAVMQYGTVAMSMGYFQNYMNSSTGAYYNYESYSVNHAVAIVGWDDNYSRYNFSTTPSVDGAWLIKNSWGPYWGLSGYFWMSYEDVSVSDTMYAFVGERADNYDHNYQYDGSYWTEYYGGYSTDISVANVFQVPSNAKRQALEAVGVEVGNANTNYSIQIYKNPTNDRDPSSGTALLSTPTTGTLKYTGFHTIKLNQAVTLYPGDIFAVVIHLSHDSAVKVACETSYKWSSIGYVFKAGALTGQSFCKLGSNSTWTDYSSMRGANVRVKAYTNDLVDKQPPVVTNVRYGELTNEGYTVYCDVTDDVAVQKVSFPTWTLYNEQDDLAPEWWNTEVSWQPVSGNTYSFRVNTANHNNEGGTYITHVYAYDTSGNSVLGGELAITVDRQAPVVTRIRFSNVSEEGYLVYCDVTDNVEVEKVSFPTWTTKDGQDDLAPEWWDTEISKVPDSGNTYVFRVNTSDHNNETGEYITDIYAYDTCGNVIQGGRIVVNISQYPVISRVRYDSVTKDGYMVYCDVVDDQGVVKVCFPTWTTQNGQDDLSSDWQNVDVVMTPISGNTYAFYVDTSKHNGEAGEYVTDIYAIDTSMNVAIGSRVVVNVPDGKNPFYDVATNAWYYPYAIRAYHNGLMSGVGKDAATGLIKFAPEVNVTREQFVQILYNREGKPKVAYSAVFPDVPQQSGSAWYSNAVMWAVQNNLVSGYDNGKFGVGDKITREQVAVILKKYAEYKGYSTVTEMTAEDLKKTFKDVESVHSWAMDSMCWAVENGVMSGKSGGWLMPLGNASRAEAATMLLNMIDSYEE